MDLKLRVTQGKNVGQEVAVPGTKFLIGRAEDCNLRPGSDLISRHHCVIIIEEGYLAVRDFGSKNGTSVNGERVVGECELKHGDDLRVGPLEFEVIITQGALSGKKKPPVHDAKEAAARTAATPVDDGDVGRWLNEPEPSTPTSLTDTKLVRVGDTDEIDVGSTREFNLGAGDTAADAPKSSAKAPAAKPAEPATAKAPAAKPAAPRPVTPAPAPFVPEPMADAPEAEVPAPAADKKGMFGGNKKTFGKLPPQSGQQSKDSRDAAANMLNKFRKRR